MPCLLDAPVLKVDAEAIHRLDTRDPQNLFSVWTVFARCADSVSQGRRLENLSWRLWTRETFCVEPNMKTSMSTSSLPRDIERKSKSSSDDVPQLSGSVDSIASEEAIDFSAEASPMEIDRPRICRQDSCASSRSRGKERHITSDDFEKLVVSIVHSKEPLAAPLPLVAMPIIISSPSETKKPAAAPTPQPPVLERSGSTSDSEPSKGSPPQSMNSSEQSYLSPATQFSPPSHTVVRGFSTSHIPMFQTITSHPRPAPIDPIPEPTSSPQAKLVQSKKQQPKFALGGSSSCDDSLSDRGNSPNVSRQPLPVIKRKMFQVGGSSEEENSLKSAMHSARSGMFASQKKQTSFSNQLVTGTIPAPVIDNDQSDTEAEDVDESAIDDEDDSSDWEDSNEESGKSSIDEKTFFQRVDSKVNLTSRRSLITLMLERNDRQVKLGNGASQSTSAIHQGRRPPRQGPSFVSSPNDSDDSPLMMKKGTRTAHLKPINEIPRSAAQPILTPGHNTHHQAALSPRTTRRNMLSTELTESLRRHLVWERSQKSSTVNAVLKRRHTSQDVANLKQYPDKVVMKKDTELNPSSYDQYFGRDAGYHSKGW
ncbi:hypothetical protein RB595_002500 [Gaeumannomyces hyphopodioides]